MNKAWVIGDIHGNWKYVRDFLIRINHKYDETDTLILLGDACFNYFLDNERDRETKEKLNKFKINLFVIRGNHEERPENLATQYPDKWYKEHFLGGSVWIEKDFPYIKYAMDYPSYYEINGYKTMVFPGAYSVDKHYRLIMGYSWFEDELLTEEEMQIGRDMVKTFGKCDLVLSHTCPLIFEPTDLFLPMVDQSKVDKTMERYLGEIEYSLDYKAWLWGHFHTFRDYPRTDGRRRTMLYNEEVIDLDQYMNEDNIKIL